jgi:chromosome segregation ATPase
MAPPTKNQLTSQIRNEKAESRKLRIALTAAEEEIVAVQAEIAAVKADREASTTATTRYTEVADALAKANHRAHVLENSVAVRTEERDNAIVATTKAKQHLEEFGAAISKLENSLVGRTNELTTERNRTKEVETKLAELEVG